MKLMKLSDTVIAHIAQIMQLAIITGTDIVDHMRMIELVDDGENTLQLNPDYNERNDENLQRMVREAENMLQESANEQSEISES